MHRITAVLVVLAFVFSASPALADDGAWCPAPDPALRDSIVMPEIPETVAVMPNRGAWARVSIPVPCNDLKEIKLSGPRPVEQYVMPAAKSCGADWSLSTTWVSDYVALGYASGSAIQTDLFAEWANGWSVDFWWSVGTNDSNVSSDTADEFDFEVAKKWKLENGLTITGGLAWFALYELGQSDGDIIRPKLDAAYSWDLTDTVSLSMGAKVEDLLFLPDWTSRWVIGAEVGLEWKATEKLSIGVSLEAQHDFGDATADAGWLITPRIGVTYELNDWLSIEASFKHWDLSGFNDGREDANVFALKFSFDI